MKITPSHTRIKVVWGMVPENDNKTITVYSSGFLIIRSLNWRIVTCPSHMLHEAVVFWILQKHIMGAKEIVKDNRKQKSV